MKTEDYIGKTIICLDSGEEVQIYSGCLISDFRPLENATYVYNEEGLRIACIEHNGIVAEVVGPHPVAAMLQAALEVPPYNSPDAAVRLAYQCGVLQAAIERAIRQLNK